ncbi:MAG: hypothetical protein AB1805_16715 [Nitrospirota bacterium]
MKILYLVKHDADGTLKKIMDEHKKAHDVTVVDIRTDKDYNQIIDLIAGSDKVISW